MGGIIGFVVVGIFGIRLLPGRDVMFGCNSITSSCDNFCFIHAMVVCCMYFLLLQMIVAAKKCCLSGIA